MVERVSALDGVYSAGRQGAQDEPGVQLQEIPGLILHQIAAWPETVAVVENSLVHPKKITWLKDEDSFGLDDARIPDGGMFVKNSPFDWIGIGLKDQEPVVKVELGNFPNVNIWTPPGYPFVCIEPMASHHDVVDSPLEIEHKSHLISLPPGQSRDYYFKVIIVK